MPPATDLQNDRREAIRRLLLSGSQSNQQQLVDALIDQGFVATQSSVSRDLKELGAVKTARGYEIPSSGALDDKLGEVSDLLRSMTPAGPNLLVIKTAIGAAQRVALAMDRVDWPDVVGTVAGDDTVFVATENTRQQRRVVARIHRVAEAS